MASRPPITCPLCHEDLSRGHSLEEHLVGNHSKPRLARFIVSETKLLEEGDIS